MDNAGVDISGDLIALNVLWGKTLHGRGAGGSQNFPVEHGEPISHLICGAVRLDPCSSPLSEGFSPSVIFRNFPEGFGKSCRGTSYYLRRARLCQLRSKIQTMRHDRGDPAHQHFSQGNVKGIPPRGRDEKVRGSEQSLLLLSIDRAGEDDSIIAAEIFRLLFKHSPTVVPIRTRQNEPRLILSGFCESLHQKVQAFCMNVEATQMKHGERLRGLIG